MATLHINCFKEPLIRVNHLVQSMYSVFYSQDLKSIFFKVSRKAFLKKISKGKQATFE